MRIGCKRGKDGGTIDDANERRGSEAIEGAKGGFVELAQEGGGGMKIFEKRKCGYRREIRILGLRVFAYGKSNIIQEGKGNTFINIPPWLDLVCYGDNNTVEFGPNTSFCGRIQIGEPKFPVHGCVVKVGEGTVSGGCWMILMEHDSKVTIGKNCGIAPDVEFWCSDTHSMVNEAGEVVNRGRFIEVGDHVWIGKRAAIMKNTKIPDGCIVGFGAIVSSGVKAEAKSIIAGNPAKVVRTGINWNGARPDAISNHPIL